MRTKEVIGRKRANIIKTKQKGGEEKIKKRTRKNRRIGR